ncbi:MAG: DUF4340 domain-containing protein, partial [Bdellovibrionales bacterium]|nr:DUF4340 domain-containing protein [Bdellovibrionales bacterium]
EVKNSYGSFILARTDNDAWTLARENIPASADEVKKMLGAILDLRAKDFATEKAANLTTYGLSKPAVEVFIKKKGTKQPETLKLGASGKALYAMRSGKDTVYVVDSKLLETLQRPAKEYRNRSLAEFNRFNIKRIRFDRGGKKLDLVKKDNKWSIADQPDKEIDPHKVEALIAKVQDTKVTRYATSQTPNTGLAKPGLVLQLSDEDGEKLNVTLKFGAKQGDQIFVAREQLPVPFLIKLSDYKEINLEDSAFVQKSAEKSKSDVVPNDETKKDS